MKSIDVNFKAQVEAKTRKNKVKKSIAILCLFFCAVSNAVQAENLNFTIFNASSASLVEFNLTTASSDVWEENLIRGGYLEPGYELDIVIADGLTTYIYDLRGNFADGSEVADYDVEFCEATSYTFTD